ncbi:MAG: BatA domain-containing protein [Vicinamibacterales bacterium]
MNFANLSALGVVAGLAGLAAVLFALQQLRTRYRDVTVVTTLFWKQVVDEAPVRKLRERFRHPLAYLLVLAICSLLWLAFAEPQWRGRQDQTFHILVLDGSAGMGAGDRFETTVARLKDYVSRLPSERRQVIWSGGELRPLLAPGEHEILLSKRLEGLAPEAVPSSLERVLRQLSASPRTEQSREQSTSILVFGDAPVRKEVLALVPSSMSVKRALNPTPLQGNSGITALGVADAASGAWDKVDVFAEVQSTGDRRVAPVVPAGSNDQASVRNVQIDVNGQPIPSESVTRAGQGFVVHDVPADGGLLTVRVAGADSLALDDRASIRLPTKPLVRVQLSKSLEGTLGPVLQSDPGVTLVEADADVVVRRAGESIGANAPTLEFVRAATQAQAFVLTHPDPLNSNVVFVNAVEDIGLKQIDAMSLAQESGRPIEVSVASGAQWRFSVWEELLSDSFNFTRSRAFPLFVANAVRWLAGAESWHPFVAAGQPLLSSGAGERTRIVNAEGRLLDPLNADFVPPVAGELEYVGRPLRGAKTTATRTSLSVSLLDPDVTRGARDEALELATLEQIDLVPDSSPATWLLVLALILLATEWYFYQMGRMP